MTADEATWAIDSDVAWHKRRFDRLAVIGLLFWIPMFAMAYLLRHAADWVQVLFASGIAIAIPLIIAVGLRTIFGLFRTDPLIKVNDDGLAIRPTLRRGRRIARADVVGVRVCRGWMGGEAMLIRKANGRVVRIGEPPEGGMRRAAERIGVWRGASVHIGALDPDARLWSARLARRWDETTCPKCGYRWPRGAERCPECGFWIRKISDDACEKRR